MTPPPATGVAKKHSDGAFQTSTPTERRRREMSDKIEALREMAAVSRIDSDPKGDT